MKRVIFKILASIIAFVGTLLISGNLMNKGNVNTTKDMEKATLPVVCLNYGGETINELYGYTVAPDLGLLRENITPLDDSRGITVRVLKFGQSIKGLTLLVRTVDGSRLIEKIDIEDYSEDDYGIQAYVTLKDLYEEYTEYSLEICLTLSNTEEVSYYTRVIEASSYCTAEKLAFVEDFLDKEMSVETNAELSGYMESNYLGDNSTLQYVNIHSSMEQLAFGSLHVTRETDPSVSIKEIASETGVFTANYLVSSDEEGIKKEYQVEEVFRIKYTTDETYLLDFKRTMNELALDDASMIRTEDILLGINDSDISLAESDDGNVIVFEKDGTLYSFNISENKIVRLFSFYDSDNFDRRTYRQDYEVRPLSVDEAGNVWFAVTGYMNRGTYEGRVGICLYYFNGVTSEREELFFIPSDQPADIVNKDLDELCFLSPEGIFYIMLDNTIYDFNVETKEVEVLVANLEENKYTVSDDSTMMVWQNGDNVNSSDTLKLMNLNTKQISEIKAPEDQYIKPLAFIGEDFIYGLAYKSDIITDSTGRTTFPMYCVKIQSKFGEILKQYQADGCYVTQVSIKGDMITLERVAKEEGETLAYTPLENEYINNNQTEETLQNIVNVYTYDNYESVVRIILKKEVQNNPIKIVPKEIIYEGTRELDFEKAESTMDYYYVYYDGALQKIYTNPANAVTEADSNYGVVVDASGYYVWYRANRDLRNQIMDLSPDEVTAEEDVNKLAYCLDMMLSYEGVVRNSEYLLNHGETVLSILNDSLEGVDVLDLNGCSLDSILYYVNRDIPVLGLTNTDDTYLIIGFNQLAVVLFDPLKGWYKVGRNEAEELFAASGNKFITYVYNQS